MPIHIGDYKRDTGHLRAAGHGAYLLLLFHHWSTGSLPTDDDQLSAIACMTKQEWKKHKPILARFFDEGWVHGRVVSDLKDANESYEKLAAAGSKGGKARAERKRCYSEATSEASSDAIARLKQPITDNQIDVADDARAVSLIGPEAQALADELLVVAGHDIKFIPPGWCGAAMRVQSWLSQGWQREPILAAVKAAASRKRGPPANSVQFFEKAIAEEIARQAAPLPVVEVREAETITVQHGRNGKTGNVSSACDDLVELVKRGFGGAAPQDGLGGGAHEADARLLPYRGSQ